MSNGERASSGFTGLDAILDDFRNRKGGDLSGGQQQQLSIGRALTLDPKLLILDEPTEGIQPSVIKEIEHVLVRIKELSDIAILMVEQYLEFAWRVADVYYIMAKGSVIETGRTSDVDLESVQKHITI